MRHDVNQGEGIARNTGIAHARRALVALLDSDDEWLPHLLATLWPHLGGHVMVGGASLNTPPDPDLASYAGVLGRRPVVLRSPAAIIYPENFVAASGTMVRRGAIEAVGGYRPLKGGADMDLWIRVLERGTGLIVPCPVVVYHLHAGQVINEAQMMSEAHRAVARDYAHRPWWKDVALERWEGGAAYDAAARSWTAGRRREAVVRAVDVVRSPTRASGAAGILLRRARLRRRSAMTDRRGAPTVALSPGAGGSVDGAWDLRGLSTIAALARLAIRPSHDAIVASRPHALAARLVGLAG